MSGIFNAAIFNNAIFNTGSQQVVEQVIKTGTGGIDAEDQKKRYKGRIYKPTGLVDRKKDSVEQRIVESRQIQKEVFDEVIGPALRTEVDFKPIQSMTPAEIDHEIGLLMREKIREDEESEMMMLVMALADD